MLKDKYEQCVSCSCACTRIVAHYAILIMHMVLSQNEHKHIFFQNLCFYEQRSSRCQQSGSILITPYGAPPSTTLFRQVTNFGFSKIGQVFTFYLSWTVFKIVGSTFYFKLNYKQFFWFTITELCQEWDHIDMWAFKWRICFCCFDTESHFKQYEHKICDLHFHLASIKFGYGVFFRAQFL